MDLAALRATLWAGPLDDPLAPARSLALDDYAPALDGLRALVGHGLPVAAPLALALARWEWSIDLGVLACEAGLPGALDSLAARVRQQGRRRGALARALWARERGDAALAVLEASDPGGEGFGADQALRAEWLLATGRDAGAALALALPALSPGAAARLRLLAAWQTGGAVALAGTEAPDDPAPLGLLFDLWLVERDLPRARAVAARLARLRAAGDPETALDAARLALESDDPEGAAAALAGLTPDAPADWPPRRHVLHLRALMARGDLAGDAGLWAEAAGHAGAAARLWPLHDGLRGLALAARERLGGWDALAADLVAADGVTLAQRARLGWPEAARLVPPLAPDAGLAALPGQADLDLLGGDPMAVLARTEGIAPAPLRAALMERRAEALLWQRQAGAARGVLDGLLAAHPTRLGPLLQRARAAFFLGDFKGAEGDLARFRVQKRADTGLDAAPDLRDRITGDALASGLTLPPGETAAEARLRLGAALARHPGLAACWLARPGAVPVFRPAPDGAIPRELALYWEGTPSEPVRRGIDRWRAMLPDWAIEVHDRDAAQAWLSRHDPDGAAAFARQGSPAGRADLFRACLIARQGGLWVDADEFPRTSPAGWLDGASCVLVLESGYGTVANNFIAALPGLPLLAAFRARVLAQAAASTDPYPWWDTGPAQLTGALAGALVAQPQGWPGLRVLSQAEYCARITTNLPFPHKHGPGHWRQGLLRPGPRAGAAAPGTLAAGTAPIYGPPTPTALP